MYPSKVRPTTPWEARRAAAAYGRSDEPDWREVDWRRHLRDVRVAGRSVNYVDLGEGAQPPVLFVHGLGASWQSWLETLPALARERRVVALDLPGFGASEMPAEPISITRYAHIVEELCARIGLGPIALVGNSMGGFVAAQMAISHPARVERLVLAAAAGISVTNAYRRPTVTAARAATVAGIFRLTQRRPFVVRPHLRHLALAPAVRHPTLIGPDLAHELLAAGRPGFVSALDALLDYDFRDRLEAIACPTLLIWGEKDMLVPAADADEFARRIPAARKVVFPDTGHMPQLEQPVAFNRALLGFLNEDAAGRPAAPSQETPASVPPAAAGGAHEPAVAAPRSRAA
jgi:pimeloyl-ACP methyl ester carboxylesterase